MIGDWTIQLADGPHAVNADLSMLTGRLTVSIDRTEVHAHYVMLVVGDIAHFDWHGHSLVVHITGMGYFGHLQLRIDGQLIAAGAIAQFPTAVVVPTKPSFVRDLDASDTVAIITSDQIPLDNRAGSRDLVLEQAIEKTISNEVQIQTSNELSAKLGINLFQTLQAEIAGKVGHQLNQTVNTTITRKQTLRLTVNAGSRVVYTVVWKRKTRVGRCLMLVNGQETVVPYEVNYDLVCEVQSQ